jgi:S-adenosylmethionine-diacylglycerol 3-amino-3-carboxypropyl transferase
VTAIRWGIAPAAPDVNAIALPRARPSLADRLDQRVFDAIYSRSLVYNTCWEDPAVDRRALRMGPSDTVLVITSAGCNALDYALAGPRRVIAVDANPRQDALLQLKLAGIRELDHAEFFRFFGEGCHPAAAAVYRDRLRRHLSPFAARWWDRHIGWFSNPARSFYYHGLSGIVARTFRSYLRLRPALRRAIEAVLDAPDLPTQRAAYDERVRPLLWTRTLEFMLSRQITMSFLGVPFPQRRQVEAQHAGGVAGFVRDALDHVFRELPARDNYFWSVYVRGRYRRDCCPEYLKPEGFAALKEGRAACLVNRTATVTGHLRQSAEPITRFVLLDHMDWMSSYHPDLLAEEWEAIFERAAPGARVIFRSAHRRPPYLDTIRVGGVPLRQRLRFDDDLAGSLGRGDRVHTYAGFHIAEFPA